MEEAQAALSALSLDSSSSTPQPQPQPTYLPFEVLVCVLSHVDQQTRHTVCALVDTTWAAAAVAASSHIFLSLNSIPAAARHARAANLSAWLANAAGRKRHHHTLRGLVLTGSDMSRPQLQLPATALHTLENLWLTNCRVSLVVRQQPGNIGTNPAAPAAQALTSLQLQGCVLDWGRTLAAPLDEQQPPSPVPSASAAFTALRTLKLQQLLPGELSKHQQELLVHAAPAALKQMTQLTSLVLKQLNQYESALLAGLSAGLGCMQRLEELHVDMMQLTAAALQDLPCRSLTILELAGAKQLVVSSAAIPRLTALSGLQCLSIEGVRRFEPRLLLHMRGLRALRVRSSSSRFLPDGTGGTHDLLAALQGLTQLQRLDLRNVLQHLLPEDSPQAYYSGLTASSVLQDLDFSACRFPPSSAVQVLHGSCSLQELRRLVLYRCEDPSGSVLQLQDLQHLVGCCPALEELSLWVVSSSGNTNSTNSNGGGHGDGASSSSRDPAAAAGQQRGQLAALCKLPRLTNLVVAGPGVSSGEVWALAQLRQLTSLAMYRCSQLTNAALLQLTQLQQLSVLAIDAHSCVGHWTGFEQYVFLQGQERRAAPAAPAPAPAPAAARRRQVSGCCWLSWD